MQSNEHSERLELALHLATEAATEVMPRFRQCAVRTKADGSEVTDADLASEAKMREILVRLCPDDDVLGEEFGGDIKAAERAWVLDPIDGTQAFALGMPTFGILIGYAVRGEPLVGVIAFPALGQIVYAAQGLGCHMRVGAERALQLRASSVSSLPEAYASATSLLGSNVLAPDGLDLGAVVRQSRRFRFVGDCLQHAMVCSGRLDAAIDLLAAPWDIAAVIPCVREAGGGVADIHGRSDNVLFSGSLLSASTPALVEDVAAALAGR